MWFLYLFLTLLFFATPHFSEARQEQVYGNWTVISDRTPDDGTPLCAIVGGHNTQTFQIVWLARDRILRLRLSDPAWRLTPKMQTPVRLIIDGRYSWNTTATPITPNMIEIRLPTDEWSVWERAWRRGHFLETVFPQSLVQSWKISLRGSHQATDQFLNCLTQTR